MVMELDRQSDRVQGRRSGTTLETVLELAMAMGWEQVMASALDQRPGYL